MAKVTIEKSVDGKPETRFSFPACFLSLAKTLLPPSAISALSDKDINIPAMLLARQQGVPYSASLDVVEKGVRKTVVVSLH